MENKRTFLVLMGTYNGEKYLREQLDSVLAQRGVDVTIKVSDDCSTDGTVSILDEYARKYPNVSYSVNEKNKNFTYNFIDMLFAAESSFDYYALCDQDDVWLPEKLLRAAEKMEAAKKGERGIMYFSNQTLVDAELNYVGTKFDGSPFFENKYVQIYENLATGCTIAFDRKFKDHVCSYYPEDIYLHDHYLFLVAMFTADYVYDENSYILYRQHGSNLIGAEEPPLSVRLKRFINKKTTQSALPRELLRGYGRLVGGDDEKYLKMVAEYREGFAKKMRLLFCRKVYPKSHFLNYRLKILIGKL